MDRSPMDAGFFTENEKKLFFSKYKQLATCLSSFIEADELYKMRALMQRVVSLDCYGRDGNGINGLLRNIDTALIASQEIGLKRSPLIALLFYRPVMKGIVSLEEIRKTFDNDVALIISRLLKTSDLYARNTAINSDNFHKLLFSFAEDVRVILLMIADRLCMMRLGKQIRSNDDRTRLATEVSYLYAPLAHRLGLYKIKGEMEDLSLKYLDPERFAFIKKKLNETKRSRDAYIAEFIAPVKKKLEEAGFQFDIKGRTKSIYSIHNKLKKQEIEFEDVYDLFAIRIILDMPGATREKERADCWQVYSIVTDMYQPNPKRMKDWISIPKQNGYESLHTTVLGPQNKWVEVQIRTQRMDEIAEKGLAAHWKYKGGKEELGLDELLTNVRIALETKDSDPMDLMKNFKMDLYRDEIYVFTPKGELLKLPAGATVLDFAFAVHTDLGCKCVSGKVNERNVPIRHVLHNGDTVSVVTSATQSPKPGWLSIVATSKARVKIKQALREEAAKTAEYAKELLYRRFKNRKLDVDEGVLMRYIKKKGYKSVTEFYLDISDERLDPNNVIEEYLETERKEKETAEPTEARSAEEYFATTEVEEISQQKDVLVIDQNLTGIEYKLAKCCNPIFGDDIFGFVSTHGIKIHRIGCPNEQSMRTRFGYRIIKARWSGTEGSGSIANLRVTGKDDLVIVNNITSVISKENGVILRSLNIETVDAFFRGHISVLIKSSNILANLIGKLKAIKGVKSVERLN